MKKRELILPAILALAGTTSVAHADFAVSPKLDETCQAKIENLIILASDGDITTPDDHKAVKFYKLRLQDQRHCAGGADDCMVLTTKGLATNGDYSASFLVSGGRGNCTVQSFTMKPSAD